MLKVKSFVQSSLQSVTISSIDSKWLVQKTSMSFPRLVSSGKVNTGAINSITNTRSFQTTMKQWAIVKAFKRFWKCAI